MSSEKITNEQIYEFLKSFKQEFWEFKTETEKHLNRIEDRIYRIEERQSHIEERLGRFGERLIHIESKIDSIHITWNTKLVGGVLATSAVVATVVTLGVSSLA